MKTGERLVSLTALLDLNAAFDTLDHFITPKGEKYHPDFGDSLLSGLYLVSLAAASEY